MQAVEQAKTIPGIITAAAERPLGILALMIIALAILAYLFFGRKQASMKVRLAVFAMLFIGVAAFAYAIAREAAPDGATARGEVVPPGQEKTPPPPPTIDGAYVLRIESADDYAACFLAGQNVASLSFGSAPVSVSINSYLSPGAMTTLRCEVTDQKPGSDRNPCWGAGIKLLRDEVVLLDWNPRCCGAGCRGGKAWEDSHSFVPF